MNYLSQESYLAFKPESSIAGAVIPTIMVPLISENIETITNHTPDQRMKGIAWKSNDMLRGFRSHEGEVVVLADPDTLGHFLNMAMYKSGTTGDADGYTHTLVPASPSALPDTYTFEIKKGAHAMRLIGVRVDELKLDFNEGQLQITAKVVAHGQFSVAKLGVATSGSITEIVLDDEYDINPTRGIVAGDKLIVDGTEVTVASIDSDGVTLGVNSVSLTKSAGVSIYLKPLTVSFATLQDPFYFGNVLAGFGADESTATTNATQVGSTPIYDLSITLKNNLFKQNGSNRLDPVQISPKVPEAQVELKQLYTSPTQYQKFLERAKQALTLKFLGKFIKSDFTTQELLTLKFHNIKLVTNKEPLAVGEYINDEQSYEVLYDNTDAKAITCTLVNRTAGSAL